MSHIVEADAERDDGCGVNYYLRFAAARRDAARCDAEVNPHITANPLLWRDEREWSLRFLHVRVPPTKAELQSGVLNGSFVSKP